MLFFTPRYVKLGQQFIKDAEKMLAYKRDLWSDVTIADYETHLRALRQAVKDKDEAKINETAKQIDTLLGANLPPQKDAGIRENVEVFLVAIVVALGVRTYFIQPFTIPTSSMYPTLNGIIFHKTAEEPPNVLLQAVQVPLYGRHYVNFVAEEHEQVLTMREAKSPLPFVARFPGFAGGPFDRTEIITRTESGRERSYFVKEGLDTLKSQFPATEWGNHVYKPGEPILRGYFDAGDHVFVDKFSLNFRAPKRGEIFVFSTAQIAKIKMVSQTSQYYIKRLGGVPGDTLRIDPPQLFVNGQRAVEPGFNRVMSGTREKPNQGYRGYGNGSEQKGYDQQVYLSRMDYMNEPTDTFTVPPHEYVALGDNSYNSWDSRGWGTVPEKSIMGRALMVYWPFLPHFGLAK